MPAYSAILHTPKAAVSGLTVVHNILAPAATVTALNATEWNGLRWICGKRERRKKEVGE